jgi:predicted metalloprotease
VVLAVVAALVVLALLAGVGGVALWNGLRQDTTAATGAGRAVLASSDEAEPPPGLDRVEIIGGDDGSRSQEVVRIAVADVDDYWRRTWSEVYDGDYETVDGGLYAATDGMAVPCTDSPEQVAGNAFYCPSEDVIAWDAEGLVPYLLRTYGDLGVGLVIAHEWGHAIQARAGVAGPTVFLEQQADCFAGAWVDDVRDAGDRSFLVDGPTLDRAVAGFLELRDTPGTSVADPGAHGSAFDRIRAFQEGVEEGAEACADYTPSGVSSRLVDLRFSSTEDLATGGNLPLQEAFDTVVADLSDFWEVAYDEFDPGGTFDRPRVTVFGEEDRPRCDEPIGIDDEVFYCPDDNVLAVQQDGLAAEAHREIGDFALGAIVGSGFALAALDQMGEMPSTAADRLRTADCLAGVWSASVFLGNRETGALVLSPGDLDEAVGALLATSTVDPSSSVGGRSSTGAGFDRVSAYRSGFTDGRDACLR